MRNAMNCAPTRCICRRKLGKPVYGLPWFYHGRLSYIVFPVKEAPIKEKVWHVICDCGIRHIWTFPDIYQARHILPLFDSCIDTTRKGVI